MKSDIKHRIKSRLEGFTIIEATIVLTIAAVILSAILITVPKLQANTRNSSRKHDALLLQTELYNYYNSNGNSMPGPYNGGPCYIYTLTPNRAICSQAYDFIMQVMPEMSFYKNFEQYFFATDQGGYANWCVSNPATCSAGARNLSVLVNTDEIFINSDSFCVGNDRETWYGGASFKDHEIIAYALEEGDGNVNYQCIDVLGNPQ